MPSRKSVKSNRPNVTKHKVTKSKNHKVAIAITPTYRNYINSQSGKIRQQYAKREDDKMQETDHCILGCDDYCLESLVDTEEHKDKFEQHKAEFESLKGKLCEIPEHTINPLSQEIILTDPDKTNININPYIFPEFPYANMDGDCELDTNTYLYAINRMGIIKYSLDRKIDDDNTQLTGCVGLYAHKLDIEPNLFPEQIVHSCIFSGNDVIAAGEIMIVNNKIVNINNESGHYRPKSDVINIAKEILINKYNYSIDNGHDGLIPHNSIKDTSISVSSIKKKKTSFGGNNKSKNRKSNRKSNGKSKKHK